MEKKIEYIGYWYLPDNEDMVIAGTLTYTPHKSISLELVGDFADTTNPINAIMNRPNPNTIFGVVYDVETKKELKKISLLNCHRGKNTQNLSCTFPITEYKAYYMVVGAHVNSVEDKLFSESFCRFNAMNNWCHPAAINSFIATKDNMANGIGVSFSSDEIKEPITSTKISDDLNINIGRGVDYNETIGRFDVFFSQYTKMEIDSKNNLSIVEILKYINHYEQFISFMSLSNVYIDSICLRDNNLFQELSNGEKYFSSIELIYVNKSYSDVPKDYLTNYEEIKEIYPIMITKWYNLSIELAPIRNHLIKSLRHKTVFDYSDFVIVAHALEGYYMRFIDSKSKKIESRYNNLFNRFKGLKVFNNKPFNAKAAADSRNYYSHFFKKESHHLVLDGLELYNLYQQMRVLLICCVLELIGLDHITIDKITSSSNSHIFKL